MKNNRLILLILTIIAIFILSAGAASAQDVDIENLDSEQLTTLLLQIMQKLEQAEEPEKEPETSAGTIVSESDSAGEPENSIWKNKKLVIEALPGYMFIQPTEEAKPEKDNTPEHYENEPGRDNIDGGPCHWTLWEGKWYCMKG